MAKTPVWMGIPEYLANLDESLFEPGQAKTRHSRRQKRQVAKAWLQQHPQHVTSLIPDSLQEAQRDDASLDSIWKLAEEGRDGYRIKGQTLCHLGTDEWGDDVFRPVIPNKFRRQLLELAHGAKMTAHLGVKKSLEKLQRHFFWPGLWKDVSKFCQACPECQLGASSTRKKAPLQPLPVIEEPFCRVAMDLVGPLRRTKRGNKYILTFMDFSSRYPEAIPLRRIDAETVAEALCGIFARFEIPQEILSDQGTQFMAGK